MPLRPGRILCIAMRTNKCTKWFGKGTHRRRRSRQESLWYSSSGASSLAVRPLSTNAMTPICAARRPYTSQAYVPLERTPSRRGYCPISHTRFTERIWIRLFLKVISIGSSVLHVRPTHRHTQKQRPRYVRHVYERAASPTRMHRKSRECPSSSYDRLHTCISLSKK